MALKHPKATAGPTADLSTVFTLEGDDIPRHTLREAELPAEVAYQIIHDELMLDGNARMNLATFVSTWMEPQAEKLMAECLDKNMIDKDEYPQTAELEMRCVNNLKMGFTHDMADLLVKDIERQLPHLQAQPAPVRDASNSSGFHH